MGFASKIKDALLGEEHESSTGAASHTATHPDFVAAKTPGAFPSEDTPTHETNTTTHVNPNSSTGNMATEYSHASPTTGHKDGLVGRSDNATNAPQSNHTADNGRTSHPGHNYGLTGGTNEPHVANAKRSGNFTQAGNTNVNNQDSNRSTGNNNSPMDITSGSSGRTDPDYDHGLYSSSATTAGISGHAGDHNHSGNNTSESPGYVGNIQSTTGEEHGAVGSHDAYGLQKHSSNTFNSSVTGENPLFIDSGRRGDINNPSSSLTPEATGVYGTGIHNGVTGAGSERPVDHFDNALDRDRNAYSATTGIDNNKPLPYRPHEDGKSRDHNEGYEASQLADSEREKDLREYGSNESAGYRGHDGLIGSHSDTGHGNEALASGRNVLDANGNELTRTGSGSVPDQTYDLRHDGQVPSSGFHRTEPATGDNPGRTIVHPCDHCGKENNISRYFGNAQF